jgi:hypothetical protein
MLIIYFDEEFDPLGYHTVDSLPTFRRNMPPPFLGSRNKPNQVRWVPCHHGMARPQVADGGDDLQIWRVATNILNKQSRTTDKGWSSSLGVGRGANNSSP